MGKREKGERAGDQLCELGAPVEGQKRDLIEIWLRGREH